MQRPSSRAPRERVELQGESFAFEERVVLLPRGGRGAARQRELPSRIPGTITAIVGPERARANRPWRSSWRGSGMRADGRVAFGGVDARDIPYRAAHGAHRVRGARTRPCSTARIADNIRMGQALPRPQAEVEAAARAAGCPRSSSARLPQGYDYALRARRASGCRGGERQRIAIARAILKDAPVVILDEATAYADPENEALVERAISKLVEGKTLVTIAHRLSTITGADQILVMDAGRIVGRGRHDELLQSCPLYARMWREHSGRGRGAHGQKRGRPGGHPPRGGEVDVRHRKTHTRRGGKLLACVATQSHCWHGMQRPKGVLHGRDACRGVVGARES